MKAISKQKRKPFNRRLSVLTLALMGATFSSGAAAKLGIGGALTIVGQSVNEDFATNGAGVEDDPDNVLGNGTAIAYSFDLEMETELDSGIAFVYLVGAEGDAVYDGANADAEGGDFADQLVGVAEAWYAHTFGDMFTITIGKIDAAGIYDASEVANDPGEQFLADVFVNNPAIALPRYTPAMNFTLEFGEVVALNFGIFDDEPVTVVDPGTGEEVERKIGGEFQNLFVIGEIDFNYFILDNIGNLRLSFWSSQAAERNGFAINFDQAFVDELFRIFMRFGFVGGIEEPATVRFDADGFPIVEGAEIDFHWSSGLAFEFGDGHSVGAAVGIDSANNDDELEEIASQVWTEFYLQFELTPDVLLAGDLQIVSNPGFNAEEDAVVIPGFRLQVGF